MAFIKVIIKDKGQLQEDIVKAVKECLDENLPNYMLELTRDYISEHEGEHHKTASKLGSAPTGNYSPEKVKLNESQSSGNSNESIASLDLSEIKGITRAFHDLDIEPVNSEYLTIPLHASAVGKSPRDIEGLFRPRSKNNGYLDVLAVKDNGGLRFMYALSKSVHQTIDPSLLPSEEDYANAVIKCLEENLNN